MARSRAKASRTLINMLPPRLAQRLIAHAADMGDDPSDVAVDAIALHLEDMERQREIEQLDAIPAAAPERAAP